MSDHGKDINGVPDKTGFPGPKRTMSNLWSPSSRQKSREEYFPPTITPFLNVGLVRNIQTRLWMAADVGFCGISMFAGFVLSPQYRFGAANFPVAYVLLSIIIYSGCIVIAGFITGLYEKSSSVNQFRIVILSITTCLLGMMLTSLFFALVLFMPIGRWVLSISIILSIGALIFPRLQAYKLSLVNKIKVIIVSEIDEALKIYNYLKSHSKELTYEVVGICTVKPSDVLSGGDDSGNMEQVEKPLDIFAGKEKEIAPEIYTISDLRDKCRKNTVEKIIVGNNLRNNIDYFPEIMSCVPYGVQVMLWVSFMEEIMQQVSIDNLTPDWFYSANLNVNNPILLSVKRVLDIFLASMGILITMPIIIIVSVLIKLTSRGPVIYSQIRTGKFGAPFNIYKFRTMVEHAEGAVAQWASEDDERCTAIGRVLRKTRIDELPQLWNIIRGEMSFVGPRPERPELMKKMFDEIPYFDLRHIVTPGLTGFAQINYGYGASIEDSKQKLQYDLYYVKHFSPVLDFYIILRTISSMMIGAR